MKQIHLSLTLYANDNDGWFPIFDYGELQIPQTPDGKAWGGWIASYFSDPNVLHCPSMDKSIAIAPTYWGYVAAPKSYYWSTYRVLAATGNSSPGPDSFYGTMLYHGSTADGTNRVTCPNINFPGQTVSGYGTPSDHRGALYIAPAAEQPAVVDCYDPSDGSWVAYGRTGSSQINNHFRLNGENLVFVDGHGEWRSGSQAQKRFKMYYDWVYW